MTLNFNMGCSLDCYTKGYAHLIVPWLAAFTRLERSVQNKGYQTHRVIKAEPPKKSDCLVGYQGWILCLLCMSQVDIDDEKCLVPGQIVMLAT